MLLSVKMAIIEVDLCQVFVYGTLKPEHHNFARFCVGKVQKITQAKMQGKLYQIPFYLEGYTHGYPAMVLETGWVHGYLFEFKNDEILEVLDQLEGYEDGRSPQENEYQRLSLPVFNRKQEPQGEAWVYVMLPEQVAADGGFSLNRESW